MSVAVLKMCQDRCNFRGTCWTNGVDYVCRCLKGFLGLTCAEEVVVTSPIAVSSGLSIWSILCILLGSAVVFALIGFFFYFRFKKYSTDFRNGDEYDKRGLLKKVGRIWEI